MGIHFCVLPMHCCVLRIPRLYHISNMDSQLTLFALPIEDLLPPQPPPPPPRCCYCCPAFGGYADPATAGASAEAVASAVAAWRSRLWQSAVAAAADSRSTVVLSSLLIRCLPILSAVAHPTVIILPSYCRLMSSLPLSFTVAHPFCITLK